MRPFEGKKNGKTPKNPNNNNAKYKSLKIACIVCMCWDLIRAWPALLRFDDKTQPKTTDITFMLAANKIK